MLNIAGLSIKSWIFQDKKKQVYLSLFEKYSFQILQGTIDEIKRMDINTRRLMLIVYVYSYLKELEEYFRYNCITKLQ